MKRPLLITTSIVVCVFLLLTSKTISASLCTSPVATLHSIQGTVEYKRASHGQWQLANLGDVLCNGDSIQLAASSRAALYLKNKTILRLDENTHVILSFVDDKKPSWLELLRGITHFISRTPKPLKINTPYANAAIEGTEFVVSVYVDESDIDKNQTTVTVLEGIVRAVNEQGELQLNRGQSAVIRSEKIPVLQTQVKPWDAVSWALHYPAISESSLRPTENMSSINDVDSDVYINRATSHLAVGQVASADRALELAISQNKNVAEALALKAIIAVVKNQTDLAIELSHKAVETDEHLVAAWLAQSYAQQAKFKLKQAKSSTEKAVEIAPNNALAWARLAELHLMFGELDQALSAAQRAEQIAPALARAQSVLGFANLTRVDIAAAELAFNKAIVLDQADPLPRLGLGLAMIRRGELTSGRIQIELAASLAPTNALIRSYLGKAYFEEKRSPLDATQLAMAKTLDPNDPTPWFYDAIRKQSENRPIEALHDLEKSATLNNNRAVYRSRLLLDEDQAVRSVGLAQIYSDLGFQSLALNEGTKSLSYDATNYAAHRFLAEAYSSLPRHQIARASELLQAQLWQPLGAAPLRPQAGEINLGILTGIGSTNAGYNEFNSLFARNRFVGQTNAVLGGDGIKGGDLVVSGTGDQVAFSLGVFRYESDGFRKNNDQQLDIYNLFIQARLSHKTSIQAELRKFTQDKGDLVLRFDPDDMKADFRETETRETFRLGLRHKFSSQSQMIVSLMTQSIESKQINRPDPFTSIDITQEDSAAIAELQYVWASERIRVITGLGYFESDSVGLTEFSFPLGGWGEPFDEKILQANAYSYFQGEYLSSLSWLLGLSIDRVEGFQVEKTQINPKFGLIWQPRRDTTLRMAAFRVLKRDLVMNQTIEPTQIVGFNQFFDDGNGTDSTRYGVSIDRKLTRRVSFGAEFSQRHLDAPFSIDEEIKFSRWKEAVHSGYLRYLVGLRTAIQFSYQYEKLDADKNLPREKSLSLATQSFPLEIEYSHPARWSLSGTVKYVDQDGVFYNSITELSTTGQDSFFIVDAEISYRLPKRYGKLSIQAKNLFDATFKFQEPDLNNPSIYPERLLLASFNLSW